MIAVVFSFGVAWNPEGRSTRSDVGVELKGIAMLRDRKRGVGG
jgi:hypothetical protein